MYQVYVLKSVRNGKFYIGRTEDLQRRYKEHKDGAVWTTKRMLPVKLIFYEAFTSKQASIRRENYFKTTKGRSTLRMMLREESE